MELKNDQDSYYALNACVENYYNCKGLPCLGWGEKKLRTSTYDGIVYEDGYEQEYFVARKYFIKYFIPIDTRNFFAMLSLAVGPYYVPMDMLVSEKNKSKFSMDSTIEAVEHNLKMLDQYLAGRLN